MAALAGALAKKLAEHELSKRMSGSTKRGGVDVETSPSSMGGGAAPIPGQDADANSNLRRKRSNGKDRS